MIAFCKISHWFLLLFIIIFLVRSMLAFCHILLPVFLVICSFKTCVLFSEIVICYYLKLFCLGFLFSNNVFWEPPFFQLPMYNTVSVCNTYLGIMHIIFIVCSACSSLMSRTGVYVFFMRRTVTAVPQVIRKYSRWA